MKGDELINRAKGIDCRSRFLRADSRLKEGLSDLPSTALHC